MQQTGRVRNWRIIQTACQEQNLNIVYVFCILVVEVVSDIAQVKCPVEDNSLAFKMCTKNLRVDFITKGPSILIEFSPFWLTKLQKRAKRQLISAHVTEALVWKLPGDARKCLFLMTKWTVARFRMKLRQNIGVEKYVLKWKLLILPKHRASYEFHGIAIQ
jgi:hypothetical protein